MGVLARLLEPARQPWKVLMQQRLASRSPLGLAAILLPSCPMPPLPARLAGYATALRGLRPHRLSPPQQLPVEQLLLEPVFHNQHIQGQQGMPITPSTHPHLLHQGTTHLHHLAASVTGAGPSSPAHLDMPQLWQDVAAAGRLPPTPWVIDSGTGLLAHVSADSVEWYEVLPSGQLLPAPAHPAAPPSQAVPAAVIPWRRAGGAASEEQLYCVGPVQQLRVHPLTWGLGGAPLTRYVVSDACRRLATLGLTPSGRCQPGRAIRPAIWQDAPGDATGIAALEARWTAPRAAHAPAHEAATPRWLALEEPPPRMHWRERQAAAQQQAHTSQGPPSPAGPGVHDTVDVAAPPAGPDPFAGVWRQLVDHSLPRPARITAWRLLHGTLSCSAFHAYRMHLPLADPAGHCRQPSCAGTPETITHLFLECQPAHGALVWVQQLWQLLFFF